MKFFISSNLFFKIRRYKNGANRKTDQNMTKPYQNACFFGIQNTTFIYITLIVSKTRIWKQLLVILALFSMKTSILRSMKVLNCKKCMVCWTVCDTQSISCLTTLTETHRCGTDWPHHGLLVALGSTWYNDKIQYWLKRNDHITEHCGYLSGLTHESRPKGYLNHMFVRNDPLSRVTLNLQHFSWTNQNNKIKLN